jgi:pheromone shutdown protein TraB
MGLKFNPIIPSPDYFSGLICGVNTLTLLVFHTAAMTRRSKHAGCGLSLNRRVLARSPHRLLRLLTISLLCWFRNVAACWKLRRSSFSPFAGSDYARFNRKSVFVIRHTFRRSVFIRGGSSEADGDVLDLDELPESRDQPATEGGMLENKGTLPIYSANAEPPLSIAKEAGTEENASGSSPILPPAGQLAEVTDATAASDFLIDGRDNYMESAEGVESTPVRDLHTPDATENGNQPWLSPRGPDARENAPVPQRGNSSVDLPDVPEWRRSFPLPLRDKGSKTFQKLTIGNSPNQVNLAAPALVDVYILGTAHISNESSVDVRQLLEVVRPDVVFVELCANRIALFQESPPLSNATKSKGIFERVRKTHQEQGGSQLQALCSVLMSTVQEDFAKELGVQVGGEFKEAYRFWRNARDNGQMLAVEGTPRAMKPRVWPPAMILGDRPIQLTLWRAWESLELWPRITVVLGLVYSALLGGKPKKEDILAFLAKVQEEESDFLTTSLAELRKRYPTLYQTVIAERDAWMAAKLTQTCRALSVMTPDEPCRRPVVVAVVGAGHVPGICEILHSPSTMLSASPEDTLAVLVTTRHWDKKFNVNAAAESARPSGSNGLTPRTYQRMKMEWVQGLTELDSSVGLQ